ncbi:MAG: DUF1573 domain-containing protein [Planctomycetes bacterium]|nr:DUF1573 domain-containing protein [Planctomycetota bacterium]
MLAKSLLGLSLSFALLSAASAQQWAEKMFQGPLSHDFGTVARASKVEHRFTLKNLYKETVHIAGVTSSCGCTTPSITKDTLNTYETCEIVAKFNTRSFTGSRSATITVTIDKPFFAEVQMRVKGTIRTDVVFSPASVQFGEVPVGTPIKRTVRVAYAGRSDWKIVDVRSANPHLEVELSPTRRSGGRVDYEIVVHLKDDAPIGSLRDQLVLITNDRNVPRIPLYVEGRISAAVTISPSPLYLGTLTPGKSVTKQLIVRSKTPFKITSVDCKDKRFEFKLPDSSKTLHVVPVTFTADTSMGEVVHSIYFHTDRGKAVTPEVKVRAKVVEKERG